MLSCLDTHFMAEMIRLSGTATFSSRTTVVIPKLDGDPRGPGRSFWVTSMRITFPLLSPHANVDMAEGWMSKYIYMAMSNAPVSASKAFHGAQEQ